MQHRYNHLSRILQPVLKNQVYRNLFLENSKYETCPSLTIQAGCCARTSFTFCKSYCVSLPLKRLAKTCSVSCIILVRACCFSDTSVFFNCFFCHTSCIHIRAALHCEIASLLPLKTSAACIA